MANAEHVAMLKQGEAAWNAWRRDHPTVRPDFSGADLRGVILNPADAMGASGADLRGADFSGADLRGAGLLIANFGGADLIPSPIDQNWCAHWRNPMDMMRQG